MFNVSSYFKVIHKNITGVDWKLPKTLSEGLCLVIYREVKSMVGETFYNKFFNGNNKGRTLYKVVQDEIAEVTFHNYIQQVIQRFMSINYRDNKFDSQAVAKEVLGKIKNATNLSGDIRNGIIQSYRLNYNKNVYIFLAEVLYYTLEIQNNSNTHYIQIDPLLEIKAEAKSVLPWHRLIELEELENYKLSLRTQEVLNLLDEYEVEIITKLATLVITEEDGEEYLYYPSTDEELDLYKKHGIGFNEFRRMKDCELIGVTVENRFDVEYPYLYGFQNDNLVLVISTSEGNNYKVEYKSYSFTQVGKQLLNMAQIETSDSFFTDLALIFKDKIRMESKKIGVFTMEDAQNYEEIDDIDWGKNKTQ
ncbi:hypothetical protein [Enterococcus malodoratus]|uniref:Uncharacterized protein n=1 Tax=Enterococcus malodoratus ATCC 43197 TaxID=1158601 RepID=R2NR29_9ENTE|nr:hypothetical protein [Enterococcus malodoratus]EOH73433.1 hypothetical protein UAI_03624 [Enterococcus malodoratus ATCC 43197]EOT67286.1 hypothetical protein I585_02807 [Enterococcus malodoratus ATCC 43197]SPX03257.1 Protein of uncharacterised function (DUF2806) [Enterococcus malodoratus]STD69462.1 Protein of uncharacterised function (DUF2806) [Enterococcus malodoratus]